MKTPLLALLIASCISMPDGVVLPASSYHFAEDTELVWVKEPVPGKPYSDWVPHEEDVEYNEFNPGLGLDWELGTEWRVEGGAFLNSFEDWAPYVGASWVPYDSRWFEFGFGGALAYYPKEAEPSIVPFVGPVLSLKLGSVWLRGQIGPMDGGDYLATFSLRLPLGDRRE